MSSYLIEIDFDGQNATDSEREAYNKFMKKYKISITGVNNGISTLSFDSKKPRKESELEKDLGEIKLKSFARLC